MYEVQVLPLYFAVSLLVPVLLRYQAASAYSLKCSYLPYFPYNIIQHPFCLFLLHYDIPFLDENLVFFFE